MSQQISVTFSWMPAYSGYQGNELDHLGASQSFRGLEPFVPFPPEICRGETREWVGTLHGKEWAQAVCSGT